MKDFKVPRISNIPNSLFHNLCEPFNPDFRYASLCGVEFVFKKEIWGKESAAEVRTIVGGQVWSGGQVCYTIEGCHIIVKFSCLHMIKSVQIVLRKPVLRHWPKD